MPEDKANLKVKIDLAIHTLNLLRTKYEQEEYKDEARRNYMELLENKRKILAELN